MECVKDIEPELVMGGVSCEIAAIKGAECGIQVAKYKDAVIWRLCMCVSEKGLSDRAGEGEIGGAIGRVIDSVTGICVSVEAYCEGYEVSIEKGSGGGRGRRKRNGKGG